jgi:hypothetical protein
MGSLFFVQDARTSGLISPFPDLQAGSLCLTIKEWMYTPQETH